MKTWNYISHGETNEIPDEWVWERLRILRNRLLANSDLKMIADAPWDVAPWKAYRQALRDLPANTIDPRQAVWPVSPDGLRVPGYVPPMAPAVEPVIEPVVEEVFGQPEDAEGGDVVGE
jgi:hypothetical protein